MIQWLCLAVFSRLIQGPSPHPDTISVTELGGALLAAAQGRTGGATHSL